MFDHKVGCILDGQTLCVWDSLLGQKDGILGAVLLLHESELYPMVSVDADVTSRLT